MKWLVGTGVSVSSIFYLRNTLDKNGWKKVKIVASSGFNPEKCLLFANTHTPVDVIGTGSYIPNNWEETYATADIIKYNGKSLVKKGREFLKNPHSSLLEHFHNFQIISLNFSRHL